MVGVTRGVKELRVVGRLEKPPVPWERWHESFETYIVVVGLEDTEDGQRIFRTLGPAATYTECVTLLAGHFAAPRSVILRRIVFRQRRQHVGESVHHYVADLRGLASLCQFGVLENELIRDQLAEHAIDPKVREKLLMSADDLTLIRAVEIAFQFESTARLASQLTPESHSPPGLVTQTVRTTPAPLDLERSCLDVNFAGGPTNCCPFGPQRCRSLNNLGPQDFACRMVCASMPVDFRR
uniref:Retrotransposon gag domain-containing protein n=1 Tax=Labrus bergylta TaxID=56723 RepID=A0A3Q3GBU2_9LABR